ncbi:MAG TPA: ABC transporter substrate-binding protein, partial [Gammaproteobacteria bacterium]
QVLPFPDDVIKALKGFTKEALEEQSAADPEFKRVYDAYTAFSKDNDAWNVLSEAAYQRARNLE